MCRRQPLPSRADAEALAPASYPRAAKALAVAQTASCLAPPKALRRRCRQAFVKLTCANFNAIVNFVAWHIMKS
jgi:hypothetical protein